MDKIIVAASTHWDREWYRTFQEFQIRLCDLMDRLLDLLEKDEDFLCYTFDGQSVVLDDYLEIHPENRERIQNLVKKGKLVFGPLYNLPDEFLSGGEGMIRNFLIGNQVCKDIGGRLNAGYVPDNFGHISQLPQILRGVGLENAFFFRGTNIETTGSKEFYWEGADGSKVLTEYMLLGYWSLKSWGRLGDSVEAHFKRSYETLKKYASLPVFLLTNGSDHLYQDPEFTSNLKKVKEAFPELSIENGSFEDYTRLALEAAKDKELPSVSGELRDFRYGPDPTSITSTRASLKRLLFDTMTGLERYTEPAAAIASALCEDYAYPEGLLKKAWKQILVSLGHDAASGCSSDEVMRDIESYLVHAKETSQRLLEVILERLLEKEEGARAEKDVHYLAVFNPHPVNWSGITTQVVHMEGPHMGEIYGEYRDFVLLDENDNPVSYELCEQWRDIITREHLYNSKEKVHRLCSRILFKAEDVPALGVKYYKVQRKQFLEKRGEELYIRERSSRPSLENEFYRITVNPDASLDIYDKKTDNWYRNAHSLVARGDAGDEYQHVSPIFDRHVFPVLEGISFVQNSELSQSLHICSSLTLPKSRNVMELGQEVGRGTCKVETVVTLYKETDRIDFRTETDNNCSDFVLYAKFPADFSNAKDYSYVSFDEVYRDNTPLAFDPNLKSTRSLAKPMQRYAGIAGDEGRMDILAKGIYEYHTKGENDHLDFYLTLLRSCSYMFHGLPVSWLDGQESTTPVIETTGSKGFGKTVIEYALCFNHKDVQNEAESYIYPLKGLETETKGTACSFLSIDNPNVQLSALKCSSDKATVIRMYQTGEDAVRTTIRTLLPIKDVKICNLLEEVEEDAVFKANAIPVTIGPKKILTLKITWG